MLKERPASCPIYRETIVTITNNVTARVDHQLIYVIYIITIYLLHHVTL